MIIEPAAPAAVQVFSVFVLAVSAVVVTLGFVAEPFRDRDRIRYIVAKRWIQAFSQALEEYRNDCNFYLRPQSGLSALIENPGVACWKGLYLKTVPIDPWGRPYAYELNSAGNPEVISYGSDGIKGGDLFAADLSSNRLDLQIPESGLEIKMRRRYLAIWLSAWVGVAASVYFYGKASRLRERRRTHR